MQETILICEDSIEGILSGIYEAYVLHQDHALIHLQTSEEENYRLFTEYQTVQADPDKSEKVLRTIYRRFGMKAYAQICQAMLSYDTAKADAVYHTVVAGLAGEYKGNLMEHLSNRYIHKVFELSRNTWGEYDHLRGFLRFRELKNKVLLARYCPQNDLTAMLMPHFANRLPHENFVIYDEQRKYYAVHPKDKQWFLMRGELPFEKGEEEYSSNEAVYQLLYRHFCQAITIAERKNLYLQRNMLPLRFRKYMTEFAPHADASFSSR